MPKFYTKFNTPPKDGVKYDESEGRTLQQFKDECDINLTVKKYGDPNAFIQAMRIQNAIANQTSKPMYGDFSELPDLQEAMNAVREAEAMFMDLPAEVRERFGNDPVKLIQFVQNPDNLDEAEKLGLVPKRAESGVETMANTPSATPVAEETQNASTGVSDGSASHA